MEETKSLLEFISPETLNWIAIIIGVLSSIITVVSVVVTIKSMRQAAKHEAEAKKYRNDAYTYKTQAFEQLKCIDMYAYAEAFTRASIEITRYPAKENNNRAGKLGALFDRISIDLADITKYTSVLGDTEGAKAINSKRTEINKFLIENRAKPTVDLAALSKLFSDTEELLRKEILNYQERLKRQ